MTIRGGKGGTRELALVADSTGPSGRSVALIPGSEGVVMHELTSFSLT